MAISVRSVSGNRARRPRRFMFEGGRSARLCVAGSYIHCALLSARKCTSWHLTINMSLKAHYVFATTASFSHVPPIINLCLALLTETPDLIISVILHVNNVDNSNNLASLQPTSVSDRLRLHSVGEKTSMKDATGTYMTMVYKSGEAYGAILGVSPFSALASPSRS